MVHLRVVDDEGGDATFVVFNNIVKKFVGKYASNLYDDVVIVRFL